VKKPLLITGALAGLLIASLLSSSCNSSPTGPTPPVKQPPPPANNTPPTIQSMSVGSPRVEADQEVSVTAVVQDAETPLDQLTYTWAATPIAGSFSGAMAQVRWRAPRLAPSPSLVTLALTVIEKFKSGDQQRETSISSSTQVHYNDSVAETTKLSMDFLRDFTTYTVSPEQCVLNFSDSCRGKSEELSDIQKNRELFEILRGDFSVTNVSLNSDRTFANITAPCTFYDIRKDNGKRETVVGTCRLTSVYENWRWFLCDSRFDWLSTTTNSRRLELQYAHP